MELWRYLKLETSFCNFFCNFLTSFWKMQLLSIIRRNFQKEVTKTTFLTNKSCFFVNNYFLKLLFEVLGFKQVVFLVAFNFNSRYVFFLLFLIEQCWFLKGCQLYMCENVCYDMSTKLHDRLLPTVKTFISAVIMHHFKYPKKAGQILIINRRNPKTMWRN